MFAAVPAPVCFMFGFVDVRWTRSAIKSWRLEGCKSKLGRLKVKDVGLPRWALTKPRSPTNGLGSRNLTTRHIGKAACDATLFDESCIPLATW
jgi:hypothetical protein